MLATLKSKSVYRVYYVFHSDTKVGTEVGAEGSESKLKSKNNLLIIMTSFPCPQRKKNDIRC